MLVSYSYSYQNCPLVISSRAGKTRRCRSIGWSSFCPLCNSVRKSFSVLASGASARGGGLALCTASAQHSGRWETSAECGPSKK